ncbi:MAG: gliding motility-associated C-terminal domain-containing protein, partial [Bacteroidota bacterium]
TYTVTGTSLSCNGTAIAIVTVNPNPVVSIVASANPICVGSSTTLTASGASTYLWNTGSTLNPLAVTPVVTTTYTVTGTTAGCTGTATLTVTVNPNPVVMVNSPAICAGTSATLTANGATTYLWSDGSTTNPITVSPAATTTYTVTGTSLSCTGTAIATVTVNPNPVVSIAASANPICAGSSTTLTASGASTYLWNTGSTLNPLTVLPAATTTYTVTGTTAGCTGTATITVTVNPNPIVTISATPNPICAGTSSTLTASGATTYLWNTGSTLNPLAVTPTVTTTYTVTGTTAGCTGTATITITVNPVPIASITGDTLICTGTSTVLTASGGTSYLWSTSANTQTITVNPLSGTTYTVSVSNGNCTASASITINTAPNPTANAGNDTTINLGSSAQLAGNGGVTFSWSPATDLSCNDCANPVASPQTTATYTLVVTDANGCTDMDTVTVNVDVLCGEVYIPNAFSPNNDGTNDLECVFGNCIQVLNFAIYDRWGEKVFETKDTKVCWDGKYKGEFMNSGVFVYYMKATLLTGEEIERQGNITLFR